MANCKFCDTEILETFNLDNEAEQTRQLKLNNWYGQQTIYFKVGREIITTYAPKYCPECGRRILTREEQGRA